MPFSGFLEGSLKHRDEIMVRMLLSLPLYPWVAERQKSERKKPFEYHLFKEHFMCVYIVRDICWLIYEAIYVLRFPQRLHSVAITRSFRISFQQ